MSEIDHIPPEELLSRRDAIEERLAVIGVGEPPIDTNKKAAKGPTSKRARLSKVEGDTDASRAHLIPYSPKTTDTHWDFVMKEMMWLGADFQGERKRQASSAKKLASSVKQFHKTKEARRLRQLHQAEMKRRKLAAKIGRDVRGWWTKIEKVIAYKQKIQADEERNAAMNKQLVVLVHQTEKYTESLAHHAISEDSDESDSMDIDSSEANSQTDEMTSDSDMSQSNRRRRRQRQKLTIEEALAAAHTVSRRSKQKIIDYSRIRLKADKFYGESTASDASGSDGSYSLEEDSDDDSTFRQAMHDELLERHQDATATFLADPDELQKLREESTLQIDEVIKRLENEAVEDAQIEHGRSATDEQDKHERRVQFADTVSDDNAIEGRPKRGEDPVKYDADDDADASDVEDYDDAVDQRSDEEFEEQEPELDDETTIAQEEAMPQAMNAIEEMRMLKAEGEVSIEELRKRYGAILGNQTNPSPTNSDSAANVSKENYFDSVAETEDENVEFKPSDVGEIDDETTLDAEEKLGRDVSYEEEMAILKRESEMPIEELRAMYGSINESNSSSEAEDERGSILDNPALQSYAEDFEGQQSGSEDDGGEEFTFDAKEAIDDETTLEAEERLGRDISYEDELALLKAESEMSVEELRAKFGQIDDPGEEEMDSNDEDETSLEAGINGEDEYQPTGVEVDDETTIEVEERLGRDMSYEDEMTLLQRESEIPIEDLRAMYMQQDDLRHIETEEERGAVTTDQMRLGSSLTQELSGNATASEDDGGEAFEPTELEAVDDETTIVAEERLGRDMSYEEEIAMLKRESEMSVEELRQRYLTQPTSNAMESERDSEEEDGDGSSPLKRKAHATKDASKRKRNDEDENASSDGLAALNALEASAERAQQTLASRPFLLAGWVKLRKYQQVGLNWLVSLQSRRLNGILADEMGLGKTLQTIALFSYLASYKGIWGPHLIVVPTSVIINWETELKRFCPSLKVLCYYGGAKRRKELRQGWTKTNWYHVVITSYQLAVQDAFAFKRKKWYYLVLDEAQNIKNFQSQRWQTLINFNTQRRLLLSGTPLQNSLMELWSLLHFLMPYIFRSRKEFSYWFSNPMNSIIQGNTERNNDVIKRLHGIIRPFILRRLKKDVETQMPGKYEHIVKCQLSRRQMALYEEFLSRSSTRQALNKGGNFMGMMNVLMQLRKVCNHPDLFEPRSIVTPFVLPGLTCTVPDFVCSTQYDFRTNVTQRLIEPLWSGSSGLPSTPEALAHDHILVEQLTRLRAEIPQSQHGIDSIQTGECPLELKSLIDRINAAREDKGRSKLAFHNRNNRLRCQNSAFPYAETLQRLLQVEHSIFQRTESVEICNKQVLLTPSSLLAMRKDEAKRAMEMDGTIDKFVFCVPKAGAKAPILNSGENSGSSNLEEMLLEPLEELLEPYRKAHNRISSFFPDKKLIQFDAGKLQTLAELLRTLKQGGHRALIFTQMSKMLDILEAFLNLNGHTYLRLDGATGVDRRQRYMDRFNNDTKIFCFILSTRSGGMGINLTGADTVIFYDSDWNPAMDAQAQDRAHRIGQTRDVHIYRLITEHTIEENILLKAKQKKNLDIMVMDQGKFDASHQSKGRIIGADSSSGEMKDVYTSGGLRAILGVSDATTRTEDNQPSAKTQRESNEASGMSNEQMESAMALLEDEDDVQALRGAQKEAAEELEEFDENAEIKKDSEEEEEEGNTDDERPVKKKAKTSHTKDEEKDNTTGEESKNAATDLEKEFAAWQTEDGFDASAIESSLSPMERYGLSFREQIDPFYSVFYINELRRKDEATDVGEEIDIEEIERQKAMEERRALDDGDLLGTRPAPENLIRQRNLYQREKARLRADKKRRKLTGENWSQKVDGLTKGLFWYNEDTGEAIWDKPLLLFELEAEKAATENGWGFLPHRILFTVMGFLLPLPDRQKCSLVCTSWRNAAIDIRFVRHVYPVEMGALNRDKSRMDYNHFVSLDEVLRVALPGDTIELSNGHYWVAGGGLRFDKPLKIIGDEQNPANVVVEMSGSLSWLGFGGFIEGVTFRRPKMSYAALPSFPMLKIESIGRLDIVHSVFDNEGSTGSVIHASGTGHKGTFLDVLIRNGGTSGVTIQDPGVMMDLKKCTVRTSLGSGIHCSIQAKIRLRECSVLGHSQYGMVVCKGAAVDVVKTQFRDNKLGVLQRETGCTITASMNTGVVLQLPPRGIPGFKLNVVGSEPT